MTGQPSQQVFLVPILVGTDGSLKMSKSLGNYIGVDEPSNEMYGKVMSIKDELIIDYFELLTDVPDIEIAEFRQQITDGSVNPMVLKKRLATEIVTQFHDCQAAKDADEHFARVFQKGETPDEVIPIGHDGMLTDELTKAGLTKSRADAKRLLTQGAIEIDSKKIVEDIKVSKISSGSIIKVGKRRFAST